MGGATPEEDDEDLRGPQLAANYHSLWVRARCPGAARRLTRRQAERLSSELSLLFVAADSKQPDAARIAVIRALVPHAVPPGWRGRALTRTHSQLTYVPEPKVLESVM
jgi:hypothetical protein